MFDDYDTQVQCEEYWGFQPSEEDWADYLEECEQNE